MNSDSGWLISVFGLAAAMTSLWLLSRARALWQRDATELRTEVERVQTSCGSEVSQLREALHTLETGMVSAQESLRGGRLNLSVRSQALQMLRSGSAAETVASSLGIATSEARLLTRVGQILTIRTESQPRS